MCGEKKKERKGITTIQEWVGCFNTYIAVALMKEPARAKDLLAYSSLIVKASSDYDKEAWLGYDRLFGKQAAAEPEINPSMWTQHFSFATAHFSCDDCGSKDHRKCPTAAAYQGRRSERRLRPWMNYQASNPESLSETPERLSETTTRSGSPAAVAKKRVQLDCITVAKLFNLRGHLQEVT